MPLRLCTSTMRNRALPCILRAYASAACSEGELSLIIGGNVSRTAEGKDVFGIDCRAGQAPVDRTALQRRAGTHLIGSGPRYTHHDELASRGKAGHKRPP